MKISHGIEYVTARTLAGLFQALPHDTALAAGRRLGRLANLIWRSRRRTVIRNLDIAFGASLSARERRELAGRVFDNIGATLAEVCRFPRITRAHILRMVDTEGSETFQEALEYGRGAILAGSHFGNWELMGAYINALGYPVDFLVRGQHNRYVDNFLTSLRRCLDVGVIHSERGMMPVMRALKDNRQVAIVADQHAGSQGIVVKFFGQAVSVPRAPAVLSVRTGAPIITGHIIRNPDNTHHCVFQPPVYPRQDAPEDEEILRLTRMFTQRIEEAIRARPDHWLWTHRRFKQLGIEEPPEGSYVE
jgi:KDO2-lipid IV(A) lauroyltransferase